MTHFLEQLWSIKELLLLLFVAIFSLAVMEWYKRRPYHWSRSPCRHCGGHVKWLEGQDSNSTAEAKFECLTCHQQEFRGGWGSEFDVAVIKKR
jgi:prepilin signal peptidase PulO-like enzyme (type II secretory pathway)